MCTQNYLAFPTVNKFANFKNISIPALSEGTSASALNALSPDPRLPRAALVRCPYNKSRRTRLARERVGTRLHTAASDAGATVLCGAVD